MSLLDRAREAVADASPRCTIDGKPAVRISAEDLATFVAMVDAWDAYDGGEEHGDVYLMLRYAEIREARARLDGES